MAPPASFSTFLVVALLAVVAAGKAGGCEFCDLGAARDWAGRGRPPPPTDACPPCNAFPAAQGIPEQPLVENLRPGTASTRTGTASAPASGPQPVTAPPTRKLAQAVRARHLSRPPKGAGVAGRAGFASMLCAHAPPQPRHPTAAAWRPRLQPICVRAAEHALWPPYLHPTRHARVHARVAAHRAGARFFGLAHRCTSASFAVRARPGGSPECDADLRWRWDWKIGGEGGGCPWALASARRRASRWRAPARRWAGP